MSLPRYPAYKDSGVAWLGEVPGHWEVKRLKQACHVFPSNVDKKSYDGETPVNLCNYTDVYYNDTITADMEFMAATASDDQIAKFTLRAGDTIITKDSETADDIAIGAYVPADLPSVVCGYHLSMIRPKTDINGAFVKRLFDSSYVKSCVAVRANGLTRVGLGQYEIDNLELPFPPIDEQVQIAAFLDCETGKVDALIAEQQRLVELLAEKRQAVISHAVTKGLNPNATMKDSGIEWLDEVPEHWEVKRLRFVAELNPSKSEVATLDKDTLVSFLPMDAIGDDGKLNFEREKPIADVENGYTFFRDGDVTVAKITPCFENGKGAVMRGLTQGIGFGTTELIVARPIANQTGSEYLHYLFTSVVFRKNGEGHMYGAGGQKRVPDDFVRNFEIAFPPIEEQEGIATFLDTETAKFDTLTAEANRAIALLQERRSALISAAVTGKIDVRGYAEDFRGRGQGGATAQLLVDRKADTASEH
ncbi:MAG TPA: restriction endonuclease subunit S [Novimethylophilus sp.]|uniref:restriction endonuclease subunit S n=1 Tax=Novimethylophilus sp. TaxID=2137426 RepID=UPI002F3E6AAE